MYKTLPYSSIYSQISLEPNAEPNYRTGLWQEKFVATLEREFDKPNGWTLTTRMNSNHTLGET